MTFEYGGVNFEVSEKTYNKFLAYEEAKNNAKYSGGNCCDWEAYDNDIAICEDRRKQALVELTS